MNKNIAPIQSLFAYLYRNPNVARVEPFDYRGMPCLYGGVSYYVVDEDDYAHLYDYLIEDLGRKYLADFPAWVLDIIDWDKYREVLRDDMPSIERVNVDADAFWVWVEQNNVTPTLPEMVVNLENHFVARVEW